VLPVAWEYLDRAPTPDMTQAAAWANGGVFRFLLHGVEREASAHLADERLAEALVPIRTRLDTVIEMLERLSYRDVVLPPVRDIELSLARMAWHSPRPLQTADWLRIELYFHPSFLEPVVLFGQVGSCLEEDRDGGCRIQVDLAELPDAASESLARLAFLAQRRQRAERPVPSSAR